MGKAASMELIRAALRDRLAHPGRYDSGPDFMNNLPRDHFTEDDIDLWYAADRAWDQHRKHESRRLRGALSGCCGSSGTSQFWSPCWLQSRSCSLCNCSA